LEQPARPRAMAKRAINFVFMQVPPRKRTARLAIRSERALTVKKFQTVPEPKIERVKRGYALAWITCTVSGVNAGSLASFCIHTIAISPTCCAARAQPWCVDFRAARTWCRTSFSRRLSRCCQPRACPASAVTGFVCPTATATPESAFLFPIAAAPPPVSLWFSQVCSARVVQAFLPVKVICRQRICEAEAIDAASATIRLDCGFSSELFPLGHVATYSSSIADCNYRTGTDLGEKDWTSFRVDLFDTYRCLPPITGRCSKPAKSGILEGAEMRKKLDNGSLPL